VSHADVSAGVTERVRRQAGVTQSNRWSDGDPSSGLTLACSAGLAAAAAH
jgi:hypothetical protein